MFIDLSKGLASTLGETRGRTTSRVIGRGLSDLTGGALNHDRATDLAHVAMVVAAVNPAVRVGTAIGIGLIFLLGLNSKK